MAFADDTVDIQIEEIRVKPNSKFVGLTMKNSGIRQNYDLMIMVIRKMDYSMTSTQKPTPSSRPAMSWSLSARRQTFRS